jgi:hypothetical protein
VSYRVNFEDDSYDNANDHIEADLTTADVISSQLKVGLAAKAAKYRLVGDGFDLEPILDLHQIVIDVDHPGPRRGIVDAGAPPPVRRDPAGADRGLLRVARGQREDRPGRARLRVGLQGARLLVRPTALGQQAPSATWASSRMSRSPSHDPFDEVVPPIFPGV